MTGSGVLVMGRGGENKARVVPPRMLNASSTNAANDHATYITNIQGQ